MPRSNYDTIGIQKVACSLLLFSWLIWRAEELYARGAVTADPGPVSRSQASEAPPWSRGILLDPRSCSEAGKPRPKLATAAGGMSFEFKVNPSLNLALLSQLIMLMIHLYFVRGREENTQNGGRIYEFVRRSNFELFRRVSWETHWRRFPLILVPTLTCFDRANVAIAFRIIFPERVLGSAVMEAAVRKDAIGPNIFLTRPTSCWFISSSLLIASKRR